MNPLHGLYAITDAHLLPDTEFAARAEAALAGGARLIQYRDKSSQKQHRLKQASTLKQLCDKHNAILIINDDIQLAKDVDAHGVHIGKDDQDLEQARQQLGTDRIIGVSCYNQLDLARQAITRGANYIAFGSFFSSSIKPNAPRAEPTLIQQLRRESDIPICCIGGITTRNCEPLIDAGASMLAVISDLFCHDSTDAITQQAASFRRYFEKSR